MSRENNYMLEKNHGVNGQYLLTKGVIFVASSKPNTVKKICLPDVLILNRYSKFLYFFPMTWSRAAWI